MIPSTEKTVVVDAHGIPGRVMFGGQAVDGTSIGTQLQAAGFQGGPGSQVIMTVCNGATPAPDGSNVAQQLANQTDSRVLGAQANDPAAAQAGVVAQAEALARGDHNVPDPPGTLTISMPPSGQLRLSVKEGAMGIVNPA